MDTGHYMAFKHSISFATNLAANFGWDWFRIIPDIVSKLLRAAIWSLLFKSEQTPFPQTQVTFHLRPIWLQTLVEIDSESYQTLFPSFCALASEVAVLFCSNLSRLPFLGQFVDSDLLLCTGSDLEHAFFFLCHIFTQRPMNDSKIKRSNGRCFGRQQLLAHSMEISFPMNKNLLSLPNIYKALKPF